VIAASYQLILKKRSARLLNKPIVRAVKRVMSSERKNDQRDAEKGEINLRIKKILSEIMPDDWHAGELLIRQEEPDVDALCRIEKTFHNPDSIEQIYDLPKDLLDAIDDLFLHFLERKSPWKSCLIVLTRTRTGGTMLQIKFSYVESC
jgi:hypothetical protein